MSEAAQNEEQRDGVVSDVGGFLRATWDERRLIEWPGGDVVKSATGVVLVFIAICTAFLGGVDFVFSKILGWLVH